MKSRSKIDRLRQRVIDRLIRRIVGAFPRDRMIRAIAVPARMSRQARSTLIDVTLEHARPSWRSPYLVHEFGSALPAGHLISALTAGNRKLIRSRISLMSSLDRPRLSDLEYAQAILDGQFLKAFDIWKTFPDVDRCLNSLPLPPETPVGRTMAVVLPGHADSDYGQEIDGHDLVGRVGLSIPAASEATKIGSRFDYAFVYSFANWHRFEEIARSCDPMRIHTGPIVTCVGLRKRPKPSWLEIDVEFELTRVECPTCPRAYMPLRIVPWCIERGIRPTLYCADFYLGSTAYQSADYDVMRLLETEEDHILSYLRHDVFFNHAALRHWYDLGVIRARGRLAELLNLDGRSFAEALQNRWGSK